MSSPDLTLLKRPGIRGGSNPWHGPWQRLDDVEFATLEYVDWFNHRRRHGEITDGPGYTTPAAHETAYYAQRLSGHQAETQTIESP